MAHIDGWRRPLHFSAKNSSHELVKYFGDIQNGINLKANDGINCLHNAAPYGHLILCKNLTYENNFDVQTTDNDGWTQLQSFSKYGSLELFTYFADMEIDVLTKVKEGKTCIQIESHIGHLKLCGELIHKHNFNVHVPENYGWKHVSCVSCLIWGSRNWYSAQCWWWKKLPSYWCTLWTFESLQNTYRETVFMRMLLTEMDGHRFILQ